MYRFLILSFLLITSKTTYSQQVGLVDIDSIINYSILDQVMNDFCGQIQQKHQYQLDSLIADFYEQYVYFNKACHSKESLEKGSHELTSYQQYILQYVDNLDTAFLSIHKCSHQTIEQEIIRLKEAGFLDEYVFISTAMPIYLDEQKHLVYLNQGLIELINQAPDPILENWEKCTENISVTPPD